MKTAERPSFVKQTFKARDLPRALQEALHADPEAEVTVRAEIAKGRDWAAMARQIAEEGALSGRSEDLLEKGRIFREIRNSCG